MLPFLAYHGCNREAALNFLLHRWDIGWSKNDYDWLGSGVYFWVNSYERAYHWAEMKRIESERKGIRYTPFVIGALITPVNVLDIHDVKHGHEMATAYRLLSELAKSNNRNMPKNSWFRNNIFYGRFLDCAVINYVHKLREISGKEPYDVVYGHFQEGNAMYEGATFTDHAHIQVAVRAASSVQSLFVPRELRDRLDIRDLASLIV